MANDEHIAALLAGPKPWAEFKEKQGRDFRADFTRAKFQAENFSDYDLSAADFTNAELDDCEFQDARLVSASFDGAILERAVFYRADLSDASLTGAKLVNADLNRANLFNANLSGALLIDAHLRAAEMEGTVFTYCNLFGADFSSIALEGSVMPYQRTDLSMSLGLTQDSINVAFGDSITLLPADLKTPENWTWLPYEFPRSDEDAPAEDPAISQEPEALIVTSPSDYDLGVSLGSYLRSEGIHATSAMAHDSQNFGPNKFMDTEPFAVIPILSDEGRKSSFVRSAAQHAKENGTLVPVAPNGSSIDPEFLMHLHFHLDQSDVENKSDAVRQLLIELERKLGNQSMFPEGTHGNLTPTAPKIPVLVIAHENHKASLIRTKEYLETKGYNTRSLTFSGILPAEYLDDHVDDSSVKVMFLDELAVHSEAVRNAALEADKAGLLVPVDVDGSGYVDGFLDIPSYVFSSSDFDKDTESAKILLSDINSCWNRFRNAQQRSILTRLERSSAIGFEIRDGKLTAGDKPIGQPPERPYPADLDQRTKAQLNLVVVTIEEVETHGRNFDTDQLKRRLQRYQRVLELGLKTWYEPDDAVSAISSMMAREDAEKTWNEGLVDDLKRLLNRHLEMEPLLRPRQDPNSDEAILEAPEVHLPADVEGFAETVREDLEAFANSDELREIATDNVIRLFKDIAVDIKEAVSQEDFLPEQKKKKKSQISKTLIVLATSSAAAIAGFASGVAQNMVTSVEAATTVSNRLHSLLQFLQQLF